jgi:glutaredoxin
LLIRDEGGIAAVYYTHLCKLRDDKKALSEAGITYRIIDASEHQDLVEKYDVRQAPTLVANHR